MKVGPHDPSDLWGFKQEVCQKSYHRDNWLVAAKCSQRRRFPCSICSSLPRPAASKVPDNQEEVNAATPVFPGFKVSEEGGSLRVSGGPIR